jgi:tetratricopeptide (TPR) repeat protein
VNSSCSLISDDKTGEAKKELKKISAGEFPVQVKLWAETAAIVLNSQGDKEVGDIGALCSVFDNPDLPLHLKGTLLAKIFKACRSASSGIPSPLLERLPIEMNLSDEEQFICAVALAQSYMDEKKNENAFKVFDHLLSLSKNDSLRQRKLGFKYAQALREIANYDDAAKQYTAVANNTDQPSYVRSIAALSLAQTYIDQEQYDEAIN